MRTLEELSALPPEDLHTLTRSARKRLAQSEWDLAICLVAVENTGLYRGKKCGSITHYAAKYLELDSHKCTELLRTARALETLPLIREAFRQGRLGWGKIRELTRAVVPETEREWLDFALRHSSGEVQQQVSMTPRDWKQKVLAAGRSQGQLTLAMEPTVAGCESPPALAASDAPPNNRPGPGGASQPGATSGSEERCSDEPLRTDEFVSGEALEEGEEAPGVPPERGETATGEPVADSSPELVPARVEALGPQAGDPNFPLGSQADGSGPRPEAPRPVARLPGPQHVRVTLNFKVAEYAEFERLEACVRGQLRKRARREEVVLEMARRAVSGSTEATRLRYQVVIHADSGLDNAWCETDRGVLPLPTEQLEQGLAEGVVTLVPDAEAREAAGAVGNGGASDPSVCGEADGAGGDGNNSNNSSILGRGEAAGARGRGVVKGLSRATWRELVARSGGRCEVCRASALVQVHHRRARSRGGGNDLVNLVLLCAACHSLAHEEDFRQQPDWSGARDRRRKRAAGRARDG